MSEVPCTLKIKEKKGGLMEILIFEDKKQYQEAAEKFFKGKGAVTVEYASNYQEALEKISEVDGALIDIFAPSSPDEARRSLAILTEFEEDDDPPSFQESLEIITNEIESEAPVGLLLGTEAKKGNIPFVVVTDFQHHAEKFQAIYYYMECSNFGPLVEGCRGKHITMGYELDENGDPATKKENPEFWAEAYRTLLMEME